MIQCDRCRDIILEYMEYEVIDGDRVCEYCIEEEEIMKEDEENR